MTIFDGSGRTIEEAQLSAQHGVVYIDAAEWDAGIYIITLQTREWRRHIRTIRGESLNGSRR